MSSPIRIPVILLTGFLGAGKTTLLRRWLSESPSTGLRMGVVINDFGLESIDAHLISRPELPLEQISDGCVCCSDDSGLARAIQKLIRGGNCDYLVIETSGLADPDNVIDVLTDIDLLPQVQLQAVVTVVDAEWFGGTAVGGGERLLARRQIQFAHVLCLSKSDRLDAVKLDGISGDLRELNSRAVQVRLPYGLPDLADLVRREPAIIEIATDGLALKDVSIPPHLHTAYQSLCHRLPRPVDRSAFEAFLSTLNPREVVRAKGFVRFQSTPQRLHVFQSVVGHHFIEEFPAKPEPEALAILIGPNLDVPVLTDRLREMVWGGKRVGCPIARGPMNGPSRREDDHYG